ncbi:ornithine carbamoyltransferase [Candidatus Bipolaricaulota bacterium]
MRHVLSVSDWRREDVRWMLARASDWKSGHAEPVEPGPRGVLILERASLRTRIAYEIAFHALGGSLTVFEGGVGTSDSIADVARTLSTMLDIALIRASDHRMLAQISAAATIPIINALSSREHSVEVLADALIVQEVFGSTEGRKIAFVGDGGNVCASLLLLAPLLGMHAAVASPDSHALDGRVLDEIASLAELHETEFHSTSEADVAVEDADVVYTDGWPSLEGPDEQEAEFARYRVTEHLMAQAAPHAIFLHCLPAARGREVTDAVLDSEQSHAFKRLANLAPTSAAMIEWALEREAL